MWIPLFIAIAAGIGFGAARTAVNRLEWRPRLVNAAWICLVGAAVLTAGLIVMFAVG